MVYEKQRHAEMTDTPRGWDRLTAWPDLHYHTATGALVLSPSPPLIAPSQLRRAEAEITDV